MPCNNIVSIASGVYDATYATPTAEGYNAAVPVGEVEGVWRMQTQLAATDIRTHRHGDSVVDGIYRGHNCFLIATFKEWKESEVAVQDMMWPTSTTWGTTGVIGRSMACMAGQLILTAQAGTPAAEVGPASIRADRAIYSPQHTVELSFGLEERLVPIVFRLYPEEVDQSTNSLRFFTTTAPA